MNRLRVLVLMSVLAASTAYAAPEQGKFASASGFTVKYPLSWPRSTGSYAGSMRFDRQHYRKCLTFELHYGREDPRRRIMPITPGQAHIIGEEVETPVDLGKIEDDLRQDEYRLDAVRKIHLNSSGKDRCKDASVIYYTETEGPDGQTPTKDSWFTSNTEIYCTINQTPHNSRGFKFYLFYAQGDRHTKEFNDTLVGIVRSLRLDAGGYRGDAGKKPSC